MPSPLAHLATGFAVQLATRTNSVTIKEEAKQIALVSLASILPDLDVIPGLAAGGIASYHNQQSHSLLMTLVGTTLLARINRATPRFATALFVTSLSHLLLDALGSRRGLMLFWPVSQQRFSGGIKLFHGVRWNTPLNNPEHRQTLLSELPYTVATLGLGLLLGKLWR